MEKIGNIELIKKELQGSKGLIKHIRKKHIPSTVQMAELAQTEFETEINDYDCVDRALNELLVREYKIYREKQDAIINSFIQIADQETSVLKYPKSRSIIDEFKTNIKLGKKPTEALNGGITKMIIALADSNRQSRVSRSGSSLMHHISYLLTKKGFQINKDFQREYILKEGCKLDFFFPSIEVYKDEPMNCCSVACQTTSNDRFRLTFAQMPSNTRNRACTAIGSSNFGPRLGPASLTDNKLEEAKKNGVKFVILENGIDHRLNRSQAVMTYNQWFEELEHIRNFWP